LIKAPLAISDLMVKHLEKLLPLKDNSLALRINANQ